MSDRIIPTCPCGSTSFYGAASGSPVVEPYFDGKRHHERVVGAAVPCAKCGRPATIIDGKWHPTPGVLAQWHLSALPAPQHGAWESEAKAKREARDGAGDPEQGLTHSGSDMRFPAGRV